MFGEHQERHAHLHEVCIPSELEKKKDKTFSGFLPLNMVTLRAANIFKQPCH